MKFVHQSQQRSTQVVLYAVVQSAPLRQSVPALAGFRSLQRFALRREQDAYFTHPVRRVNTFFKLFFRPSRLTPTTRKFKKVRLPDQTRILSLL